MSRAITVRRSAAVLLLAGLAALTASPAGAQPASLVGRWDGVVVVNGLEVPFPFEVAAAGPGLQGSFFNGERRITSTAVTSEGPRTARARWHGASSPPRSGIASKPRSCAWTATPARSSAAGARGASC